MSPDSSCDPTSDVGGAPIRLLILNSWPLDPAVGSGTARSLAGLAQALTALGHDVTLLGPASAGRLPTLGRLAFNFRLGLGRISESAAPVVVGVDIDGCFYRPVARQRYVVMLKGVIADELRFERGWTQARLRALSRLEGINVQRAARVIASSEYNRRVAVDAYGLDPGRVVVVPEGIDMARWETARLAAVSRDPPTILCVARAYPRKNIRSLISAVRLVLEDVPEARLRVVGGGPELPTLRTLVDHLDLGDQVTLLGEVASDESLRREFERASVFCLPTRQEGFGIVFLEAMAAGLPVVASNTTAVPEVVRPDVDGLLVDPLDVGGLARALTRVLSDRALAERLGRNGRVQAARFDWPNVARRFADVAMSVPLEP